MMHFEQADMVELAVNPNFFGPYDAFAYGHFDAHESTVLDQVARGRQHLSYQNVLNYPLSANFFNGPWFTWFHSVIQVALNARMVSGGLVGLMKFFPDPGTCEHSELVDWADINATNAQAIIDKVLELRPWAGFFWDQSWIRAEDFFFCDSATTGLPCTPCPTGLPHASYLQQTQYRENIMEFYRRADETAASRGVLSIKNGDHRTISGSKIPYPIYLENSADNNLRTWEQSVAIWKEHPQNILSIIVPNATYLPELLAEYREHGGWVAVTTRHQDGAQAPEVLDAYAQIQAIGGGV